MSISGRDPRLSGFHHTAGRPAPDPFHLCPATASPSDLSERLTLEAALAATSAQLSFHRLLAGVAARFGAIAPEAVDDAIVDSFRQSGEALQLDSIVLWRQPAGEATAVPAHYWVRSTVRVPEPVPVVSMPSAITGLAAGDTRCVGTLHDIPENDREFFHRCGLRSAAVVPVPMSDDTALATLVCGSTTSEQTWAPAILEPLRLFAGVLSQAFARKASNAALQKALGEISLLRDRLTSDNVQVRREVKRLKTPSPIVSESAAIQRVLTQVQQVAPTPATVLLLGETGSGKEVMAQAIHDASPRHRRPMIRVSCAAIPTALIESELFGRERGAYTGALSRQIGRFEAAHGSHAVPRRDRRSPDGSAGQAAPRAPGTGDRAARQHAVDQSRRPHHRRHQPRSRRGGREQDVPRGSFLSPQRLPGRRAAAARAGRGHSVAGLDLHRRVLAILRQGRSTRYPRTAWPSCSATRGPATCASCAMSSNGRSFSPTAASSWSGRRGSNGRCRRRR